VKTTARNERIVTRLIEEELRDSFIDYSMSVIVQRALPDARDGLKPVHRRILYAMYELGLLPDREHKKCATVVGDVLGKYHPHGDSAVYDTLVRMVQEFSLRYPLVDGQGNFGSIDGDSAAAYRYTEAKLAPVAMELLTDIDHATVDFVPNFDGRLQEPTSLPARLPHLLLNGSDGIAVGMATKVPPHNLRELAAATDHLVRHPECSVEDLVELVEGPDFPTGGYIWGWEGIGDAYRTGRGLIEMRARMHLEEGMYGKTSLVVTELPYQVNKTRVIEQITKIVRSGRVDAITDLRDESDRDGVRLVIELKRDANMKKLLRTLFLKTQLKSTFGVIMLALVNGKPQQLDLKDALQCFVDHRLGVIRRRAAFELDRSEDRAHVLEGLLTALDHIDRVIELIRGSTSPKSAADRLCAEFGLSQRQAEAILAMRLARLTQLERKKLIEELEALRRRIDELRFLVEEDSARRDLLRAELAELSLRYGDDRRTEILDESETFPLPSGESGESSLVMISRLGYAKAQAVRGSGGTSGAEAMAERDGDFVRQTFVARGSTEVLLFTAQGSVHSVPVKELPRGTRSSRGKPISDLVELAAGDRIVSVVPVPEFDSGRFLLFVTRDGQVKRTSLAEYSNVRSGGIRAIGLAGDDEVMMVRPSVGTGDLLLATRRGLAIRFAEEEVRVMGRTARGVRGIELGKDDVLVAALVPRRDSELLVIGADGYGKRVPFTEMKKQGRAGKGMAILPDTDRSGSLVGLLPVHPGDLGMCELASGEVVPIAVEALPVKPRRGASVRIEALGGRAGPIVAVHPLRVSVGEEAADGEPASADVGGVSPAEGAETEVEGATSGADGSESGAARESQAELEL
jgi:DNA gyrase subunit A